MEYCRVYVPSILYYHRNYIFSNSASVHKQVNKQASSKADTEDCINLFFFFFFKAIEVSLVVFVCALESQPELQRGDIRTGPPRLYNPGQ